jgi:hypothetical protein
MNHIYILLGGFFSVDGLITSAGMYALAAMLSGQPNTKIVTLPWGAYEYVARDIQSRRKTGRDIVIAYSGGVSRASWLPPLPIDLMVLYDPSPSWQMKPIPYQVKRTVCYENSTPMFFNLGGGKCTGKGRIAHVAIAEPHMLVQLDPSLHRHTFDLVRAELRTPKIAKRHARTARRHAKRHVHANRHQRAAHLRRNAQGLVAQARPEERQAPQ